MNMENNIKTYRISKSSNEKEIHSNKYLHQETRKNLKQINLYLKELEKEEQVESKVSESKEIKIRGEINKIAKKRIEKNNETKRYVSER